MITTEQILSVEAEFLAEKKRRSKTLVLIRNWVSFFVTLLLSSYLLREPMSIFFIIPTGLALLFIASLFNDYDWYDENSPTFGVDEEANWGCIATIAIPFFLLLAGYTASQIEIHSPQLLLLPALAAIVALNYVYLKRRLSDITYSHPFDCFTCCMKSEFNDARHCPFCGFETKSKEPLQALKQHVKRTHPEIMQITNLTDRRCSKCSQ